MCAQLQASAAAPHVLGDSQDASVLCLLSHAAAFGDRRQGGSDRHSVRVYEWKVDIVSVMCLFSVVVEYYRGICLFLLFVCGSVSLGFALKVPGHPLTPVLSWLPPVMRVLNSAA